MQTNAEEILKKIEDNGFEAYIVGGFVRDYYLGKKSLDVDICTSATPQELSGIFEGAIVPSVKYGAVALIYKNVRYELTTYRKDISYDDYRRPDEVEYIDSLIDDLKRRDFTINTLCMNSKGEIIDLLGAKEDLDNKIIKTVGDPNTKFAEDVLRILRALRFATTLNFEISDDVKEAIITHRHLLTKLSYTRKKEELTKIFANPNVKYGISLIRELKLDGPLELSNISQLKPVDDILGIWAQLDVINIYPFSKVEKETVIKVTEALTYDVNNYTLYKYGLYIMSIVASIKGLSKAELTKKYNNLPIKSRTDVKFDAPKICQELQIAPGHWLSDMYLLVEKEILNGDLPNQPQVINDYVINHLNATLLAE